MAPYRISTSGRLIGWLLVAGFIFLTGGLLIFAAVSEAYIGIVNKNLSNYWRTTYDILVRPKGIRSSVEEKYNLVEANFLAQVRGGINFRQYEAIRAIPDIEVAAPLAVLGYLTQDWVPALLPPPEALTGVLGLETSLVIDRGAFTETIAPSRYYAYYGPASFTPQIPGLFINTPIGVNAPTIPLLVAAVDPQQEALLVGLDHAVMTGTYLSNDMPLLQQVTEGPDGSSLVFLDAPVLLNVSPYTFFTATLRIVQMELPPDTSLEAIVQNGGIRWLDTLPVHQVLVEKTLSSLDAYAQWVKELANPAPSAKTYSGLQPLPKFLRKYKESPPPPGYKGLVLEALPSSEEPPGLTGKEPVQVYFKAIGIFSIENIPKPADVNRIPLETYFPPIAILQYDEKGQKVSPTLLLPSLWLYDSTPSPPLALTTLEAARRIAGEDCISAIRVRVGGIDKLTPEAQRKIEAVASEIHRKTGLDVDIMVGSSPRRVLVHVPGVGYVEEQWVQKNVTLSYHRRIQSGHLLLIAALLVTGGLFAADMAWADLLARQRVLALQKALGWRSSSLMGQVLRRAFLTGLGAGLGGAALAAGALALARQPLPSLPWLLGIPLLVTGLSVLGSLYPALQAARVPPIPLLQMAGLRHRAGHPERARGRSGGILLPVRYALLGVARRWSRSLLAGMTAALSAGLLVLLVGVVTDRAGYLSGTLLGEYILVQVEGYHWMLVGVGFGLAAAGMGNSLLAGVLERRREIGVLKALGWRTGAVARLFLLEGAVLGLLGGLAGTALGIGVYLALYRSVGVGLLGAVAAGLGVPAGVGVLAAAYPARVAARVPPAEAVRGE